MNIRWSESAVLDLENIKNYISRDSEYYANEFTARIIGAVEKLFLIPSMGRKVPEADNEKIREIIYYNYRIMYLIESAESILVLAIIHAAREFNNMNLKPWEVI
jgi:plasmid stabilization system protein ParE